MRPNFRLVLTLVFVLWSLPLAAAAPSQELFGGALGGWLRSDAQPELATLLGKHPRFRGERVRVVAMQDGLPAIESDGLTQAIRAQLTHMLTRVKGVQLVWNESVNGCSVPKKTSYLLGVEVVSEGRNRHLVRVAMVDVDEGVWVSGAHLQWRGALTPQERTALRTVVVDAPAGTIDKPLPASARDALVEQLLQGIQCTLQGGVEGSVHIAAADESDSLLADVAAQLRKRILRSAWLVVAESEQEADWQLQLREVTDVGDAVVATLVASSEGKTDAASAQRLAAVYVRRSDTKLADSRVIPATQEKSTSPQVARSVRRVDSLIEGMHEVVAQAGDRCYPVSASCLEVEFEVAEPGYLLVLRTSANQELNLSRCDGPKKTAGTKRFRLSTNSGSGFYAIATTDRAVAEKLHRELFSAAKNCQRSSLSTSAEGVSNWLTRLENLIENAPQKIHWRAFYFSDDGASHTSALAQAQELPTKRITQGSRR